MFYLSASLPNIVFQLASGRAKGISNCHINILMGFPNPMIVAHYDLMARHAHLNYDVVVVNAVVILLRGLKNYVAAGNSGEEAL